MKFFNLNFNATKICLHILFLFFFVLFYIYYSRMERTFVVKLPSYAFH